MHIGDIEIVSAPDGEAKLPPQYFLNADFSAHQALLGPDGNIDIPLGASLLHTSNALLLGDAVTCPVQLEEPDWQAMSDIDRDLASRTRAALFCELEGTTDVAAAAHFPGLEFGRVLAGQGKRCFSVA